MPLHKVPKGKRSTILLLGQCGLMQLIKHLRALSGADVIVGHWTQTELAKRFKPDLIYVDLFPFDTIAPFTSAAVSGKPFPKLDLTRYKMVVGELKGRPVVYRGIRRPYAGAFGLIERNGKLDDILSRLEAVLRGERILDVQGLWAAEGIAVDDVLHGMGHGEVSNESRQKGLDLEAAWIHSIWASRFFGPIKCIVVDLDNTLINGLISADDFHDSNPAWLPKNEKPRHGVLEAWWRLRRGFHEALRIATQRGIVLALASRNDPKLIRERFIKRPLAPSADTGSFDWMYDDLPEHLRDEMFQAHPKILDHVALDIDDFVCVEAGGGLKSDMCKRVAKHLGIGEAALAFFDDSPIEREEVRKNVPKALTPDGTISDFRMQILHGPRFTPWERTKETKKRFQSYRSRSVVSSARDIGSFLKGMKIKIGLKKAGSDDLERARELFQRTNLLNLTGKKPEIDDASGLYMGWCRDRIADHGLVSAALVKNGQLINFVCSCRVLPHRVAASLLHLLLKARPGIKVSRKQTDYNGVTINLIEEAREGIASWVQVVEDASVSPKP